MNSGNTWKRSANGRISTADDDASIELEGSPVGCEICNGALWVAIKPVDNVAPPIVSPCSCRSTPYGEVSRHLRTYAQLGVLSDRTFESLDTARRKKREDRDRFQSAIAIAKEFADNPRGWLTVLGASGSGKTHLVAAIVNQLIGNGNPAKYVSALGIPDIIQMQRVAINDDSLIDPFTALLNAPILAIDDFGAQRNAEWIDTKIDQLITHRFNGRMPTVIVLADENQIHSDRISVKLADPDFSAEVRLSPIDPAADTRDTGIPRGMAGRMTFDSFDPNGAASSSHDQQVSLGGALEAAMDFAATDKPNPAWLYLHGEPGVGKTHLAVAVANIRATKGELVKFWFVPDLLDNLRQTFARDDESSYYNLFEAARNAQSLVLDDFAGHVMTDWAIEKLYQLLSFRYDHQLPTVITSQFMLWGAADNSRWNAIQDHPQWLAILSRLNDSAVVTSRLIAAPDYRNRGL